MDRYLPQEFCRSFALIEAEFLARGCRVLFRGLNGKDLQLSVHQLSDAVSPCTAVELEKELRRAVEAVESFPYLGYALAITASSAEPFDLCRAGDTLLIRQLNYPCREAYVAPGPAVHGFSIGDNDYHLIFSETPPVGEVEPFRQAVRQGVTERWLERHLPRARGKRILSGQ